MSEGHVAAHAHALAVYHDEPNTMSHLRPALAALLLSIAFAGAPSPAAATPPVFAANGISVHGFVRYWKGFVNRTDRVVLVVALVGATALFIITRGKWLK